MVRRPPDRVDTYRQELLLDRPDLRITLQRRGAGEPPLEIADGTALGPGATLLWYGFPGRRSEVGGFYDAAGQRLGYYGNVIHPIDFGENGWEIRDLFLDVWLPARGPVRLLDQEELNEATERGWVTPAEAEAAAAEAGRILAAARRRAWPFRRTWPPPQVRRWPLELVPALRLRRDRPGTYWASLTSGRLIAWGLYAFGLASATSILFAAFTDAFVASGSAETAWIVTLGLEALALAPLCFGGHLPATRWPRPALTDERTLFIGTLAAGLAVLALNETGQWSDLLAGVYATLAVFLTIFAVCRAWFDRAFPTFAVAGLVVSALALWILL